MGFEKRPFIKEKPDVETPFGNYLTEFYPELRKQLELDYMKAPTSMNATRNGVRKFSRNRTNVAYPQEFLNGIAEQWTSIMSGYEPRPATHDEISREMSAQTASGWPHYNTKYNVYKQEGVADVYDQALKGIYSPGIWSVCAKSEVLSTDKELGGERNFVSGHFPGYISYMTWAIPMADYFHANWRKLPSKVGSSKYLGELKSIFESMKTQYSVYSLDVKGMEFDFPVEIHKMIEHFRKCLCPQFDWEAAYKDLVRALIRCPCCGRILQKDHGNCSGHGGTIDDNGLAGIFITYIAWYGHCGGDTTVAEFLEENRFAIVGDDCLYSGPMTIAWLQRVFKDCGFVLKLEKETPTPEGAIFLSHEYSQGKVFSTRPHKLLARLLFYKYDRLELATVLVGFDIELMYCKVERQIVRSFGRWYAKTYGVKIPWMSDFDISKLYNGI